MKGRNRWAVCERLVDVATYLLDGEDVLVTDEPDTNHATAATLTFGPPEGEQEVDSLDTTFGTDRYTVPAVIETFGHDTAREAKQEAERLLTLFEAGLGSTPALRHPDVPFDLADNGRPYFDGVQTPTLGTVNGPRASFPDEGVIVGWVEFSINCRTHMQR